MPDAAATCHPHEPDIRRSIDADGRCRVCALIAERDEARLVAHDRARRLHAIRALHVTTHGDDRIHVDTRPILRWGDDIQDWLLHWDGDGWAHHGSGTSGTLGQMLHAIASTHLSPPITRVGQLDVEEGNHG